MKVDNRLVTILVVGEMTLVALGALAWKWPLADAFEAAPRRMFGQVWVLIFGPLWLAGGWLLAQRKLATATPRPSEDYRQWTETSLIALGVGLAVMQAWVARNFIAEDTLGREALLRGMTLFIGAMTAAQGNFLAKLAPPTGAGAPEPSVWTRVAMRMGWAMALVGLGVMVCALTLRPPALFFVTLAATFLLMAGAIRARRALTAKVG
jgi:hypothetical protein